MAHDRVVFKEELGVGSKEYRQWFTGGVCPVILVGSLGWFDWSVSGVGCSTYVCSESNTFQLSPGLWNNGSAKICDAANQGHSHLEYLRFSR